MTPEAHDAPASVDQTQLIARLSLVAAGFALFFSSEVGGVAASRNEVAVAVMVTYLAGFALIVRAVAAPVSLVIAGRLALVATLAGLALSFYGSIQAAGGSYLSTVHASTHQAADMVLDGENPYSADSETFKAAMQRFRVPSLVFTRTEDGEFVEQLVVYPAGHVLAFVPVVASGLDDVRWFSTGAGLLVVAVLWAAAPAPVRPFTPIVLLVNPYASHLWPLLVNVDSVWVLPVLGVVFCLHRRKYIPAAILLGIATSMRLHPLLLVPFLLVLLWKELPAETASRRLQHIAALAAVAAAAFTAINLPFMLSGLDDWYRGVTYAIVTAQQGGGGITGIEHIGIEPGRPVYAGLALAVMAALTVAYAARFYLLRNAFWLFPAVILWFTPRPLPYYTGPWVVVILFALLLSMRAGEWDRITEAETESLKVPA